MNNKVTDNWLAFFLPNRTQRRTEPQQSTPGYLVRDGELTKVDGGYPMPELALGLEIQAVSGRLLMREKFFEKAQADLVDQQAAIDFDRQLLAQLRQQQEKLESEVPS